MRPSICKIVRHCVECRAPFYPKRTDRLTFCSRNCSQARQRADAEARKAAVMQARALKAEQARAATAARREARAAILKPVFRHVCALCKTDFTAPNAQFRRFCSRSCSRKAARIKHRALHGSSTHRQRARLAGVAYEPVDPLDIMRRDRWKCQVCFRPAPQRLRGTNDPRAPELDHIVPLALKGPHTAANLQCACRSCNIAKGAQWQGQRRLFG
jgi:5-methylcytosine-specific restriction endonuclease McrA